MGYGLPVEGEDGPFVAERVTPLPTCRADQTVADARAQLEESGAEEVVVVAGDDLAVGLVDAGGLEGAPDDAPLPNVMGLVPGSVRPSVTVASLAEGETERVLVTTPDGRSLGMVEAGEEAPDHDDHPDEDHVEEELDKLMETVRQRFGDREPTAEELHEFLRERLMEEGRSPEEADRVMAALADEPPA
jgi:CBS domain-containing protein